MSGFGEGFDDFAQEPKKVFVNFLIFNVKLIEQQIYFGGSPTGAIRPLRGLIDSLDTKSKEKLKPQYERLVFFEHNSDGRSRTAIEGLFREILSYLHQTYLREVRFAKPKYLTTGKLGVPE